MGRVILCTGNTARTPYLLKKMDISVYTVEELCHCIRENTFLMDEDMACRELAEWLREECGLDELADLLLGHVKAKSSVSVFLTAILEYTGFYPKEETRRIGEFLQTGAAADPYERQKNAADYLAGNGKYELAMMRYHELLHDLPQEESALRASVLHNMGYVNSRLFLFDRASELFYNAYMLSGEKESFLQFLAARRLLLAEEAYVDFIAGQSEQCRQMSLELEKRVERTAQEWTQCRQAQELEKIRRERADRQNILEDAVEQMKQEYRSMVREK